MRARVRRDGLERYMALGKTGSSVHILGGTK